MLSLVLILIAIGVGLYVVGLIEMDPIMLKVVRAVVILLAIIYVLRELGLLSGHGVRLP